MHRYMRPGKLGNLRVFPVTQVLQARKGESLFVQAKFVIDTVNNFLSSADPDITTEHVPSFYKDPKTDKLTHATPAMKAVSEDWGGSCGVERV